MHPFDFLMLLEGVFFSFVIFFVICRSLLGLFVFCVVVMDSPPFFCLFSNNPVFFVFSYILNRKRNQNRNQNQMKSRSVGKHERWAW